MPTKIRPCAAPSEPKVRLPFATVRFRAGPGRDDAPRIALRSASRSAPFTIGRAGPAFSAPRRGPVTRRAFVPPEGSGRPSRGGRSGSLFRIRRGALPRPSPRRRSGGSRAPGTRYVSRVWSRPSRCRIVACRSWTWTGSSTTWKPRSSVLPSVMPGLMPPPASHMVNACGMVVAAQAAAERGVRLDHRRAAELAAPDDQRVVEQPAPLQVEHQRRGGPVGLAALGLQAAGDVGVVVPALVIEVDEPDAPLDQPAGEQAVVGERRLARLGAVEGQRLRRLAARGPSAPGRSTACGRPSRRRRSAWRSRGRRRRRGAARFRSPIRSSDSRWSLASTPGGLVTLRIGSPLERNGTPWYDGRQEAAATSWPPRR